MKDALDFYKTCLLPAYRDWINDRIQEHKIRHVIGTLNDIAEWIFQTVPTERANYPCVSKYRDHAATQCPGFGIIHDIADGTKHVSLTRRKTTRRVTRADQTEEITFPDVDAVRDVDALTDWNGLREWGVTEDDGKWTALSPVIEQVKAFWEVKLKIC